MSELSSALQEYLRVRRALGYKLKETERLLGQFVAYCEQSGASRVTTDVAVAWATLPAGADAGWWSQRLSKVRCFAAWLQTLDPATQVPPADILSGRPRRAVPYVYADAEVAAIMAAARGLRKPLPAAHLRGTHLAAGGHRAAGRRDDQARPGGRAEGVAEDVGCEVLDADLFADARDGVVHGSVGEASPAPVEHEGRGVGAGPVGAFVVPIVDGGAGGGVQWDFSVLAALAVADDELAFTGGGGDVVGVEGDEFADAGPGVEEEEGGGAVPGGGQVLDGCGPGVPGPPRDTPASQPRSPLSCATSPPPTEPQPRQISRALRLSLRLNLRGSTCWHPAARSARLPWLLLLASGRAGRGLGGRCRSIRCRAPLHAG